MFREVIGIPSFYVMLYRARQGHVQPRRHCKHKRDKNPDNPAWSLGSCSLTREVLSSIAEYRSPDLSPGKQRSRPQAAKVVAFSWASCREAANHEEQKQGETETGSAEDQARPSGSGSRESRRAAVLASLHSPESQRSYRHAIDEFVGWYCSEPRLSFNKTVVTRYR